MVIFFKRKGDGDSDDVHMLVKVVDRYNFDGSYVYFSESSVNQLVAEGKWIVIE